MKFSEPDLDSRFDAQPWWAYRDGMIGFWLICASVGGLLAVLVR